MDSTLNGGKPNPLGVFRRDASARTAGTVTAQAGGYKIADTSTTAKVGDIYRPETATTAAMVKKEYKVIEVPDANSFVIASKDLPTSGDTFYVLAEVTPQLSSAGVPQVTVDTTGLATSANQTTEIGFLTTIATRGQATKANSAPVVLASDDDIQAKLGIVTETAPASDTASSGLNGRLQRIAQRLTSLITLFPTGLGSAAAASSFAVTSSTEDVARVGIITETAPASDTASSGLNGRLQRIAQRITSMIALLPTALGQGTMSQGLKVVWGTDQSPIADLTASGNITTQNLVPAGVATASSAVASGSMSGQSNALVQVTGVYTGALSLQGTVDGTNWITVGGIPFFNINSGAQTATITSAATGIFQIEIAAFAQFRITGLAAMTGTAVVTIRSSAASGLIGLDSALPTGANVIGALSANQSVNIAQMNGVTTSMGAGTSDTGTQRVTHSSGATATEANVPSSTSNTTLLAASTSRLGAAFFNDSTSLLYLKFGATASSTSYTVQLVPNSYYEIPGPHIYNGIVDGIWVSANGNCRVTSW